MANDKGFLFWVGVATAGSLAAYGIIQAVKPSTTTTINPIFQPGQTIQSNYTGETYVVNMDNLQMQEYQVTNQQGQISYIPFINQSDYTAILG